MHQVILSLGSNIGTPIKQINEAYNKIETSIGVILKKSSFYKTSPWGNIDQNDFINSCISIKSNLKPEEILEKIHKIEQSLDRTREIHWGPRTIDIDIIAYNEKIIDTDRLKIPHPYISERLFVLIPLQEITKEWKHPISKKHIETLISECKDNASIEKLIIQ